MSASSHPFPERSRDPSVLGELLHSLSQPLTSLRCTLELSLELEMEEVAERRQESVLVALQQTEDVIGMIQLLREYLDAEQPLPEACPVELVTALRSVTEELASIALVRGIRLRLLGTCMATLPVPEARLRLALQYLIATLIDAQPADGRVTLLLSDGPTGGVLRTDSERVVAGLCPAGTGQSPVTTQTSIGQRTTRDPARATLTLRRVRLAIASRVLEGAGASLVFNGSLFGAGSAGFVLRIPHAPGVFAR